MDILAEIIAAKRKRIAAAKQGTSLTRLREQARTVRSEASARSLTAALSDSSRLNIIAEFKRRSPSKGLIRADAEPAALARAYERGGAAAISVLTEEDFFSGSLADLEAVREAVPLPILRKDFIVDEYQVWETAAAGAAALLLIVAALDDVELKALRETTEEQLQMDALVEVHTVAELHRALRAGASLIGVNNRNLHTFEISLNTSVEVAERTPQGVVLVSESGLHNAGDLRRLADCGFSGFLIGEALMRTADPERMLVELVSKSDSL